MKQKQAVVKFLAAAVILTAFVNLHAQTSQNGSANTSYGAFNWQVDQAPSTVTFTSTVSIATKPTGPQYIPIPKNMGGTGPVSISSTTVHSVQGNISLAVWQSGSCGNGSVIAELWDQNSDVLAAVKLQVFGVGSANVPISATFTNPLSVSTLELMISADQCGNQTLSVGLVMN